MEDKNQARKERKPQVSAILERYGSADTWSAALAAQTINTDRI